MCCHRKFRNPREIVKQSPDVDQNKVISALIKRPVPDHIVITIARFSGQQIALYHQE